MAWRSFNITRMKTEKDWSDLLERLLQEPDAPDVRDALKYTRAALLKLREPQKAIELARRRLAEIVAEVPCDEQRRQWILGAWLEALEKVTSETGSASAPEAPQG